MCQKQPSVALRDNYLGRLGLTTRHQRVTEEKPKVAWNDTLFTNEAILTSLNKPEKSSKFKYIGLKRPSIQESNEFCQLLKISSLATKMEKNQKQLEKQNVPNSNKINHIVELRCVGARPKSAICRSSGFTDLKICNKEKQTVRPQVKQEIIVQFTSNDNKNVSKELILKDKILSKISLFTSNANVFIPRTNNKHYGPYFAKTKMDQLKLKSRQESSRQKQHRLQRNTVCTINQKELHEKCRQILNLDGKVTSATATKSIKRKKINLSQTYSQEFKLISTQCSAKVLKNQETQIKRPSNSSFSQYLDSEYCENLKDKYKIVKLHKKERSQLSIDKNLKYKCKYKSKKQSSPILKHQTKMVQPSLYIQRVELGAEVNSKQKQYYRVSCPESLERNRLDIQNRHNCSTLHKKDDQVQLAIDGFNSRQISIHT